MVVADRRLTPSKQRDYRSINNIGNTVDVPRLQIFLYEIIRSKFQDIGHKKNAYISNDFYGGRYRWLPSLQSNLASIRGHD